MSRDGHGQLRLDTAVRQGARRLAEAGLPSPRVDAEVLAAHVSALSRPALQAALLTGTVLSEDAGSQLRALVDRRAGGQPLQHLTGWAGFRRLSLAVGPGVFVPRPETELLAGWAIAAVCAAGPPDGRGTTVLDVGTGTGAIAAAVADEAPGARVLAIELDPVAHGWAARNLAGTGVELLAGDGTQLDARHPELAGQLDVLVANPPYIPLDAWESVPVDVRDHDPGMALWGGADGLAVITALVAAAGRLLRPGGIVGIEHADVQGGAVIDLLAGTGRFRDTRDHRDLAGRPRYTTACLSPPRAVASGTIQP